MKSIETKNFDDVLEIDENVFSLDSIKKSVYKFSSNAEIQIEKNDRKITLYIKIKDGKTPAHLIKENLNREILDQDLRESIKKETESVRNLILANAFSKTKLIEG